MCVLPQDRAAVAAAAAQAAAAGKIPLPVGPPVDDKLCRPVPPGTPAVMDPNVLRYGQHLVKHLYTLRDVPRYYSLRGRFLQSLNT